MKKIFVFLASILLAGVCMAQQVQVIDNPGQSALDKFLGETQEYANYLINSYNQKTHFPIQNRIFNLSNYTEQNFFKSMNSYHYDASSFMAAAYFSNLNVNNQDTPFCFIIFNGKNFGEIKQYLALFPDNSPKSHGILEFYLSSHEFGHCLESHFEAKHVYIKPLGFVKTYLNPYFYTDNDQKEDLNYIYTFANKEEQKLYFESIADSNATLQMIKIGQSSFISVIINLTSHSDSIHATSKLIAYLRDKYSTEQLKSLSDEQIFKLALLERYNYYAHLEGKKEVDFTLDDLDKIVSNFNN